MIRSGWFCRKHSSFPAPYLDNIRYAKPQAAKEDVIRAAKMANAHDFIARFPDGFATPMWGTWLLCPAGNGSGLPLPGRFSMTRGCSFGRGDQQPGYRDGVSDSGERWAA